MHSKLYEKNLHVYFCAIKAYVFDLKHKPNETFIQCVTFNNNKNTFVTKRIYLAYNMIGFYLAPLFVMIFCYFKIFQTIAKHSKEKISSKNLIGLSKYAFHAK